MVLASARRPLLRSTLFAFILAVGTVAGAVGRDASGPTSHPDAAGRVALGPVAGQVQAAFEGNAWVDPEPDPRYDGRAAPVGSSTGLRSAPPTPPIHVAVAAAAGDAGPDPSSGHQGRDHVWMPALGIDRSVASYACSNASYPGNRVYRWGCAGSNNVYLFGHAGSVFRPLHDAYVHGRLRTGMKLFYADGSGTVHAYKVSWWKVTTPTKGTWAYQSLSRPSLTLQTCVGAASQYRLIVRLDRLD